MNRAEPNIRYSKSLGQMKPHYAVVVIGSGYGGSIAASRLARVGQSVCLLERGAEKQPGEYPDEIDEGLKEIQVDSPLKHVGHKTAMFDFRANDDIHVVLGCGLGGTSLINANVSLKAEPRVFDDEVWPQEIRDEVADGRLERYYQRARDMLKPNEYPLTNAYPKPCKTQAHEKSAQFIGEPFKLTPINVVFEEFDDGRNHVGVPQQPCTGCGDCVSGCNYGAKNTVLMNYLPDAVNHGAEIFTQAAVRWIQRQESTGRWLVFFQPVEMDREKFNSPPMFVAADTVVISAGALGSTEILLRSAEKGLNLSDHLGRHFTGNGDVLAFSYNCDQRIHGIGDGAKDAKPQDPVGPCITSVIDAREKSNLDEGMVIEEGSTPGVLGNWLPAAFASAAATIGKDEDHGLADAVSEGWRGLKSMVSGPDEGAVDNTQTMLVMTHDNAGGKMHLEDDRLRISWRGVGEQPIFEKVNANLEQTTEALGGTFIRNPLWTDVFKKDLVTVHPLGGCSMADDASRGVVNHRCQVYAGTSGDATHDGLYVVDGAVMPRSLGVNPLLTICAIAERACEQLVAGHGWGTLDTADHKPDSPPGRPRTIGFRFTEKMVGHIAAPEDADRTEDDLDLYRQAAERGEASGGDFHFVLTVDGLDLDRFLAEKVHEAHMMGTVRAPTLSAQPLTAVEGRFNLFTADPEREHTKEMRYAMKLVSDEGQSFFFTGFKRVHDDSGIDVWTDTSTLYITIHEGANDQGEVLQRGVLKIAVADFTKQMTTMQITDALSKLDQANGLSRFGKFFSGELWDTYGITG